MSEAGAGRILIAEDEAVTALALEQCLLASGYEVCALAATGRSAQAMAESTRPTLAVVDVRLKDGVTGHAAAHDIQTRLGIPVILMSGHCDETRARQAGVVGFLAKPFAHEELVRMIDTVLRAIRSKELATGVPGLLFPNHFTGS